MGGLLFLILLLVVVALFFAITWPFNAVTKTVIALVLIVPQVVDSELDSHALREACEKDMGVTVVSAATNVDGVLFTFPAIAQSTAKEYGYSFVEAPGSFGATGFDRSTFVDGKEGYLTHVSLIAEYDLTLTTRENGRLTEQVYAVRKADSRTELGHVRWFSLRGGWVVRMMDRFSDGGPRKFIASCTERSESQQIKALLHATLIPRDR